MVRLCMDDKHMICLFFFVKQKTAYEMLRSLVGSEMCIRDSYGGAAAKRFHKTSCGKKARNKLPAGMPAGAGIPVFI